MWKQFRQTEFCKQMIGLFTVIVPGPIIVIAILNGLDLLHGTAPRISLVGSFIILLCCLAIPIAIWFIGFVVFVAIRRGA